MPSHFMSILVLNKSHKYTKEHYQEEGMDDHTLTGLAGPLHSGCYIEVYSSCTAGPYLFPCGYYKICAGTQIFSCLYNLLSFYLCFSLTEKQKIHWPSL